MIRRVLLLVFLPVVVLASALFVLAAAQVLPWWSLAFGVAFWVLLWRRRRLGVQPLAGAEDGPLFSPFRGGGY